MKKKKTKGQNIALNDMRISQKMKKNLTEYRKIYYAMQKK